MSSTNGPNDDLESLSDDEKDEFIRGVLTCQVWSYTTDLNTDKAAEYAKLFETHTGELGSEYDKLLEGEDHEFGQAAADYFAIPYKHTSRGIRLKHPYDKRYAKAWVKLGVEPSKAEKLLNIVTLGVLGNDAE